MAAPKRPGKRQIFTPCIRLKNGNVLHASKFGKKVFVFWVDDDKKRPR